MLHALIIVYFIQFCILVRELSCKPLVGLVDALNPSQHLFSHGGSEPPLPGYYQSFSGTKMFCTTYETEGEVGPAKLV